MKIKLFVLVVFVHCYSNAQPYLPFLEEGNTWSVDVYYDIYPPCDPTPCQFTVTPQISLGGIESIDGIDYTRVITDGSNTCLLREDNGIVYKYDVANDIERILFDFTLELDDIFLFDGSAYSDPENCVNQVYGYGAEDLLVVGVDFLELAGELRKVITFDQGSGYVGNFQWIEGIGNITGFDFLWETIDITAGYLLVCFETNGTSYFFNDATSCDNTTLGLENLETSDVVLYPNPVVATSILQFSSEGLVDLVKIFDVTGRLVKEENVSIDYVLIDAMKYRSGLYFYQVFSENKLLTTEKFIIK